MQNMGETLLQKESRYWPSVRLSRCSLIWTEIKRAPTGYPHKNPHKIQNAPSSEQWKILENMGVKIFSKSLIIEVFRINCDKIKKGSKVGSKVSNQSRSPFFDASNAERGKISMYPNNNKEKILMIFFNPWPAQSFIYHMRIETE